MKNRLGKWLVVGAALSASAAGGAGCLTRPVGQQPPTTKVNFTSTISQQQVDKVDLLFMIDNSASMGDKQEILAEAVPNLVQGLLKPRCVDANGKQSGTAVADPTGSKDNNYACPQGTEPEFKPVSDMHIGIVSSSLGSFGGDVCPDSGRLNDRAHLLNLVKGGQPLDDAKPSNFLAWYPATKDNEDKKRHPNPPVKAVGDITALSNDFQQLVTGVEQNGCGLEAQMESWYRFLVQPDPWQKIVVKGSTAYDGRPVLDKNGKPTTPPEVDVELLQQRADFLRPDSLVAIIALTDEDDSSPDPLAVGGQGWAFDANQFPGSKVFRADGKTTTAPRATSACKTDPGSPDCTSCGFAATCDQSQPACQKIKNDPECQKNGGYYGPTEDQLNVRYHRMKERYGIDPQYPISRYVDGLTKPRVPDRSTEHVVAFDASGNITQVQGYSGTGKCTNPLFAKELPSKAGDELCNLPRSTRSSDLIFFAVVGGVPQDLLHFDPASPEKSRITDADWVKILGRDPIHFDYSGIDARMIQSVGARQGRPGPTTARGDNGQDPQKSFREWETGADDLQYACTFDLPKPRSCTSQDPSCDCASKSKNPPLCGPTITCDASGTNCTGDQVRAKAYPTIREFEVVRALGDQGIASSLCPIALDDPNSPTYGYNPAVATIIDRLKNALTTQCLPQKLTRDPADNNSVPCLVLAQLGDATETCEQYGLKPPQQEILDKFREQQKAESGNVADGGLDLSALPVCEVPAINVAAGDTCKDATSIGWCYVENAGGKTPAGRCPQALIFSTGSGQLAGARFSLQCIKQLEAGQAAGDSDAGP